MESSVSLSILMTNRGRDIRAAYVTLSTNQERSLRVPLARRGRVYAATSIKLQYVAFPPETSEKSRHKTSKFLRKSQ